MVAVLYCTVLVSFMWAFDFKFLPSPHVPSCCHRRAGYYLPETPQKEKVVTRRKEDLSMSTYTRSVFYF